MTRAEYIAEHRRLVDVLKHPTPSKLRREAREQQKDLQEAKMPAPSKAMQALSAMALHHPEKVKKENRSILSMSKSDLRDFASTSTKGLPEHSVPLGSLMAAKKKKGRKK